jgi:hypothetical protein
MEPGRWVIEGYDVVKSAPSGWSRDWEISRDGGQVLHRTRTLTEARAWIRTTLDEAGS